MTFPAAPYVEITNKTVILAYLYLEVENTGGVGLTFHEAWTALDVTGKRGGTVYAYRNGEALTGGEKPTRADGEEEDEILKIPTFTVNQLSKNPDENGGEGSVKVYAYLIQKVGETSAAEAYAVAPAP